MYTTPRVSNHVGPALGHQLYAEFQNKHLASYNPATSSLSHRTYPPYLFPSRSHIPILPTAPLPQRLLPAPFRINHLPLFHIDKINTANPTNRPTRLWRLALPPPSQRILEASLAEVRVAFADTDAVDVACVADRTSEWGRWIALLWVGRVSRAGLCCWGC